MRLHRIMSLVAMGAAALAGGCAGEAGDDTGSIATDTSAARGTTAAGQGAGVAADSVLRVADIMGASARYVGQTVTVEGELEEVLGSYAFKMDEEAVTAAGIDNDLRVFWSQSASLAGIDDQWRNDRVRVTGRVARLTVLELEREVGWDLSPELEAELEASRPVLIATSVERVTDR